MSAGDKGALESGIPPSDMNYGVIKFAPVHVDRTIHDGEKIRLGQTELKAIVTPGHTPGCTTWTTTVIDRGHPLKVVFLCSITVAGSKLVGNKGYPEVAKDFRRSFAKLENLPADIVLPGHPELADVMGREQRKAAGDLDAFVDRGALKALVVKARADFEAEYAKAQAKP